MTTSEKTVFGDAIPHVFSTTTDASDSLWMAMTRSWKRLFAEPWNHQLIFRELTNADVSEEITPHAKKLPEGQSILVAWRSESDPDKIYTPSAARYVLAHDRFGAAAELAAFPDKGKLATMMVEGLCGAFRCYAVNLAASHPEYAHPVITISIDPRILVDHREDG
jgi:hypothetical protein